jgi:hypothetical protein
MEHVLPLVGHLHPGRRRWRHGWQRRRRQGDRLLHDARRHSQRHSARRSGSRPRGNRAPPRTQSRRHHRPPEHPVSLAHHRVAARDHGIARLRRALAERRLRRRGPQRDRLPAGRHRSRRNRRRFTARCRDRAHAPGQQRLLQPAAQVQNLHHRLPGLVLLSRDQRHRPHRDSPRPRSRLLRPRRRRTLQRTAPRRAPRRIRAARIRPPPSSAPSRKSSATSRVCAKAATAPASSTSS